MPDLNPNDMNSLFAYMEADTPPATGNSEVVKMFLHHLKSMIGGETPPKGADNRRAQFRSSFFPGFQPNVSVTEAAIAAACPGDQRKWAAALLGMAVYNAVPEARGKLNTGKLQASIDDLNRAFADGGTKLFVEYFCARGVAASEANRTAYINRLLSTQWRSATALKQKSGNWKNPSWEMYCHWVKLSACWGKNVVVERDLMADQQEAEIDRREQERRRKGLPPPFIDERSLIRRNDVSYDGDINRVFTEIQTTEPKVDLSGFPDIAPKVWTTYRAWNRSTPINSEMLGADAAAKLSYYTWESSPFSTAAPYKSWHDRAVGADFADANSAFR